MNYLAISVATAADHSLVVPTLNRKVRVLGFVLIAAGAVVVTWKSGSDAITGAMTLATGTPLVVLPGGPRVDPVPILETAFGATLKLTLGGAVQVSGWLLYDEVN